ncbi:hypothetical protein [Mesorhizobium sp. 131-2-1]|uniref:hypothetical protein n=1 Tax=Mesorhizobium sp. 131-2-1 TaxID=2744518 RepID=UPI001928E5B3|nr:hypothetical protein [Mesorhizobium sp. 131-2-1]BCG92281.1 hypothetical protein MesoLj131a_11450 [Mesorhizobium sp. 131-2-1]
MTRAALCLLIVGAVSVGAAKAETPREAYEACLAATMARLLPTSCARNDVMAKMIIFACSPQLLSLVQSMPSATTLERAALPEMSSPDETDEIIAYLARNWTCRMN